MSVEFVVKNLRKCSKNFFLKKQVYFIVSRFSF